MVPGLGEVQAGDPGGTDGLEFATNSTVPEGAKSMAEGTLPVGTAVPFAVNSPVLRSMLKLETVESPWLATNTAPVPDVDDEVLVLQALKTSSKTGSPIPARNRNLVPILFSLPVVFKLSGGSDTRGAGRSRSKSTLICVSGMNGKSKPRWLVGTTTEEESCPPQFSPCIQWERFELASSGSAVSTMGVVS